MKATQLIYPKSPWRSTPLYSSGYNMLWANILLRAGWLKLETLFWICFKTYFPLTFIPPYPLSHFSLPEPTVNRKGNGEGNPEYPRLNCKNSPQLASSRGFDSFSNRRPFGTHLLSNIFARWEVKSATRSKPSSASAVQCLSWQSGLVNIKER